MTLTPILKGADVPLALRERIDELRSEVIAYRDQGIGLIRQWGYLSGALDVLGDGVDDRALNLEVETGLDTVQRLMLDLAARIENSCGCMAMRLEERPT